jgi:hypothetical protein
MKRLLALIVFLSGCSGGDFTSGLFNGVDALDAGEAHTDSAPFLAGGASGKGGAPGSGGGVAAGGAPELDAGQGSGGSSQGTGGSFQETGGSFQTGGAPGTGGGSGGTPGTGGVESTGGTVGTGGAPSGVCCKFALTSGTTVLPCDTSAPWWCTGAQTFSCAQPGLCTIGMTCYESGGLQGGVVEACD